MSYTINDYDYKDTSSFGGLIFPSDFCTEYEGTRNIIGRILSDRKFDQLCKEHKIGGYDLKPIKNFDYDCFKIEN